MSLIINGIDFDQRLQNAKKFLYDQIDWRAQCEGLGPFFRVIPVEPPEDATLKILREHCEWIKKSDLSVEDKKVLLEECDLHARRHLLTKAPDIQFELRRL